MGDWLFYSTPDGDPWALFRHGRHSRSEIMGDQDGAQAALDEAGFDETQVLDLGPPTVFFIRMDEESAKDETRWYFCDEHASGAIAVTGWRL